MLCCIKNNRFECYKGNTIALKLFLPGAEVFPDQEAKRPYALKIKHPRKETTLQFAAEGEMQFKMWLSAFIKAASISVSCFLYHYGTTLFEVSVLYECISAGSISK